MFYKVLNPKTLQVDLFESSILNHKKKKACVRNGQKSKIAKNVKKAKKTILGNLGKKKPVHFFPKGDKGGAGPCTAFVL